MVAATFTGRPSLRPGLKCHWLTASMAFSSKRRRWGPGLGVPWPPVLDASLPKAEPQAPHDPRVVGEAVGSDHYLDHHGALQPRGTCFIAVLRLPSLTLPTELIRLRSRDTRPPDGQEIGRASCR